MHSGHEMSGATLAVSVTSTSKEHTDGRGKGRHERKRVRGEEEAKKGDVCWLLNVPATCQCISGTDLRKQFYVLPH